MEVAAMLERPQHRLGRLGLLQRGIPGKGGERVGIDFGHSRQPAQVARAAVDAGPGPDLVEHRLRRAAFDRRRFLAGKAPHGESL
jgi:hypothetical protein